MQTNVSCLGFYNAFYMSQQSDLFPILDANEGKLSISIFSTNFKTGIKAWN